MYLSQVRDSRSCFGWGLGFMLSCLVFVPCVCTFLYLALPSLFFFMGCCFCLKSSLFRLFHWMVNLKFKIYTKKLQNNIKNSLKKFIFKFLTLFVPYIINTFFSKGQISNLSNIYERLEIYPLEKKSDDIYIRLE